MPAGSGGYLWLGSSGCLLPFLIIFNLFFGRLFFHSGLLWLEVEGLLILVFMLQIKLLASRINRQFYSANSNSAAQGSSKNRKYKLSGKVIDIQAQEVKEEDK